MIGIYQDNFIQYLKDHLGEPVRSTSKNIICRCPYCEYQQTKKHYHLYISLEAPIFHCFHNDCQKAGTISKLCNKLEGRDISEQFIDKEKIKEIQKNDIKISVPKIKKTIITPELDTDLFKEKSLYLKGRLKYSVQNLNCVKGLIFDVNKFVSLNQIPITDDLQRVINYLQSNFVGFLTEDESIVMFRNIDDQAQFRFFKLFIEPTRYLDYYKLSGGNPNSNHVVIAEGIFDIFNEQIYDYTSIRKDVKLYAAALSTSYEALIKSLVFNEKIYRIDVSVLSDRGVNLDYYKKIKYFNSHIINRMDVYYNRNEKDFGGISVSAEKFILS
jgi:hypothetical protein